MKKFRSRKCGEKQMLKWKDVCYIGKNVENPQDVQKKITAGEFFLSEIFLITLSEHPDHLLEFFPCHMMFHKKFRENCPEIIGMTKGKQEAMELICSIISDVYYETKGFQVAEYLKNR